MSILLARFTLLDCFTSVHQMDVRRAENQELVLQLRGGQSMSNLQPKQPAPAFCADTDANTVELVRDWLTSHVPSEKITSIERGPSAGGITNQPASLRGARRLAPLERDAVWAALRLLGEALETGGLTPNDGNIGDILTCSGDHRGVTGEEAHQLADKLADCGLFILGDDTTPPE